MIHEVGEVLVLTQEKKEKSKDKKEGIIFCDPRTSGLFDVNRFEIIENREKWRNVLGKYETLTTDPLCLTQELREKLE